MGKTLVGAKRPVYLVDLPPTVKKEYKFTCSFPNCGKRFYKPSKFKAHEATHSAEKPLKCSFDGCSSAFYRKNHLKRHEATRHFKVGGDYKCTFDGCYASFETSHSLYYHNKRTHSEKKYKCFKCSEMFSKKFLLKEHEYGHTGVLPFRCYVNGCGQSFPSHALSKSHQKQHRKARIEGCEDSSIEKKLYSCSECPEVFEKWSDLSGHKKAKHGSTKCSICKKSVLKSNLREHVKTHDETRDQVKCPYEGCSRMYSHARNLNNHIRSKHEGHHHECEICHQKLSTKQKLTFHILAVHKNEKQNEIVPVSQPKPFNRDDIINALASTDGNPVNFEYKRPGPPKGLAKVGLRTASELDHLRSEDRDTDIDMDQIERVMEFSAF